eukprot:CAMPEP_0171201418 /NCGR_PEP_ID=MMETSP0790-20130122/24479_1 /TAXON_ID=2925 /ORGANISM="Alexandrium catenella, Strain OF101" /LENGTH=130 /DNA_ID=CAMNT_0011666815 /DNA_START=47 /DNA_END=439 /DNA_ORIENTATION=+
MAAGPPARTQRQGPGRFARLAGALGLWLVLMAGGRPNGASCFTVDGLVRGSPPSSRGQRLHQQMESHGTRRTRLPTALLAEGEDGGLGGDKGRESRSPEERTFGNPIVRLLIAASVGLVLNIVVRTQFGL